MRISVITLLLMSILFIAVVSCKKENAESACDLNASFVKTISQGTVSFTQTTTNIVTGDSIRWSFGDGNISYDMNPVHQYTANGNYIVTLRVRKQNSTCISEQKDTLNIIITNSQYSGTGAVTQGAATTTVSNLFPQGIRVAALGTIQSTNNQTWSVPADVNFTNTTFPFASDLYNSYVSGHSYSNSTAATAALNSSDIITIDNNGEVYTAYIFADNYFEMYVKGQPVGKDPVPYTEFNSSIVRFKATRPFNVAIKCVDWEEHLGLGTELNGTNPNYVGDGGIVVVIKDATGNIVDVTNDSWKAQTFYTAPISDLTCLSEVGNYRYSTNCSTTSASANSYGIHWAVPTNWFATTFDDSNWPAATIFSNTTVGVNNKPSYTNFTDIFDAAINDASFIWSTNLLLDNMVLIRKTIL